MEEYKYKENAKSTGGTTGRLLSAAQETLTLKAKKARNGVRQKKVYIYSILLCVVKMKKYKETEEAQKLMHIETIEIIYIYIGKKQRN